MPSDVGGIAKEISWAEWVRVLISYWSVASNDRCRPREIGAAESVRKDNLYPECSM